MTTKTTPDQIIAFAAQYVEALNAKEGGNGPDDRLYHYSFDQTKKWIRVKSRYNPAKWGNLDPEVLKRDQIHAFVDLATGLVYRPWGRTQAASGWRYDLTDPSDRKILFANCEYTGTYLYKEQVAELRAAQKGA